MTFLKTLLGGALRSEAPAVPAGYRVYAIGDVHGRDDLLQLLLDKVDADAQGRRSARQVIVFLGDLIDRGPSSAEVVERLRTYRPAGTRIVMLAGNHEEVLLRIIGGETRLIGDWLRFGGAECLASYGVDVERLRKLPSARALDSIRSAIPAAHVEFLRSFDDTFRAGDYLFVHAGIRPGVPLGEQLAADLRWIREPFLSDPSEHGFTVVHGHTIRDQVEDRGNRIGIDTGAYRYGVLTALVLEGAERRVLQASAVDEPIFTRPEWNSEDTSALDTVSSQSG